ncbi:adenosylcobinamide-GDP ribazoletransferase [Anaerobacillus alkaliphilus]|uniref:Adenosylcobinamide-GDP ribazoletransferase n=1 Tax=Anaerobacillus alkaliphilus TaxID=1548597 RepID=A0A4Q0VXQ3_9BACI|nr:adenosylcobinamide-GDP ribazoletransferase [Anaerobacillus alkaliphilus]RXJ03888.1 adenosylcobinamide-GDP ribazoletransferase [Anaerobacillus alkaliphilus]
MKWKVLIKGLALAFQLLSTVPIRKQIPYEQAQIRVSVSCYPIVGFCLGMILFSFLYMVTHWTHVSTIVLALLLVTIGIVFTGGLHLDGWMDCSDAFFSYRSQEEKLEIMKDPRIGAFAAISLFLLLAWKLVIIYEVITLLSTYEYFVIVFIPFLSRMILGLKLYFGNLARAEGMAFAMRKLIKRKDSLSYLVLTISIFLILCFFLPYTVFFFCWLVASSVVFYFVAMLLDRIAFGGITGDTLGASVEGSELWLWMTLYLLLSFVMG